MAQQPFYDESGNVLWAKSAGGKQEDQATSLSTDQTGNCYITGFFNSASIVFGAVNLTNSSLSQNMFLVKYDQNGNVVWAVNPGTNNNCHPSGISADLFGNIYITGYFWLNSISFGSLDILSTADISNPYTYNIFLASYTSDGHAKWARGALGETYAEADAVATDASGAVYIVGSTSDTAITFGTHTLPGDIFLVRYDSSGNVVWAANAYGVNQDNPQSVTIDNYGSVYVTGSYYSWLLTFGTTALGYPQNLDLFLAKCSTTPAATPILTQPDGVSNIFPNPVSKRLTVTSSYTILTLSVTNTSGQLVYTGNNLNNNVQLDVSGWPAGLYFVTVNGSEVKKFIKQ